MSGSDREKVIAAYRRIGDHILGAISVLGKDGRPVLPLGEEHDRGVEALVVFSTVPIETEVSPRRNRIAARILGRPENRSRRPCPVVRLVGWYDTEEGLRNSPACASITVSVDPETDALVLGPVEYHGTPPGAMKRRLPSLLDMIGKILPPAGTRQTTGQSANSDSSSSLSSSSTDSSAS